MQHSFDVELAKEYGILEAILIQNIYFWIEKNKANNKHFYDGRYWTYNSRKAFSEMFPYSSYDKIRRALEKLENLNILITENYNKQRSDRTLWYSFSDVGLSIVQKRQMQMANFTNDIGQNCQMTNGNTATPIPYINTYIKPDNNYIMPIPINDNIECESNCNNGNKCSKTAKLKINGHCFCGQHARIYLTKIGKNDLIAQVEQLETHKFQKPTLEEVQQYCLERNNNISAEKFIDYYESNGWKVGRNSMKDWKAAVRNWEKNQQEKQENKKTYKSNYEISQEALRKAREEFNNE